MSEPEKPSDLSEAELEELLHEWLNKQTPWNLHAAIWLLLRKNPNDPYYKDRVISFAKETELNYATRAFILALKSIEDPAQKIRQVGSFINHATSEQKALASDYSVYKKDFIAWAEGKEWDDDASHLTKAHKRYNKESPYSKKHATTVKTEPRRSAHREANENLRSRISLPQRRTTKFEEFKVQLREELKSKSGVPIYGETKLRNYFKDYQKH